MCQSIAESYAGKSIFITGCTGFLGKVLLEKILYSCSDLKKVYILLRGKRGLTIQERLKTLLELPVFSRVYREKAKFCDKIEPIVGDVSQDGLGISPEDRVTLINEVSYVFHSAASIKFTEPLHDLLNVNVKGTERVLSLCKCMKKLEVLVHVSTAYSNTHKIFIEEKVYPSPIPLSMVDHLIKEQPDEERTKIIIRDEPNAYTFSKKLGEALLAEKHGHVPVIIIRPSIVTASLSEPIPGWIDNWNGATGLIGTITKGILRVVRGNGGNVLDLIPVDYVVNLIIVAATKKILSQSVNVYACATSTEKPLTLRHLSHLALIRCKRNKFNELPFPGAYFTNSKLLLVFLSAILQTSPLSLADALLRMTGKDPKYRKILRRIEQVRDVLEIFTSNSWKFSTMNNYCLYSSLSPSDQKTFPFSPSLINWSEYIPIYFDGMIKYLFKENPVTSA
ncbi:fatty acyl-CoA reductase 1-like [Pieris brassicae]|uniref:fatty acyl-CoA reductase 1-like n=1 Tax=Pieris brassicae TaxID=7116 RepID=UPI001E65E636|nr:fatty acyl-CoA reductase 1-like [Pieris brassicae]